MRRRLSFKANPIPDFYHEAAPPKLESKNVTMVYFFLAHSLIVSEFDVI